MTAHRKTRHLRLWVKAVLWAILAVILAYGMLIMLVIGFGTMHAQALQKANNSRELICERTE